MTSSKILFSVVLAVTVSRSHCQTFNFGSCPSTVTAMTNFVPANYLGVWYEYAKYKNVMQGIGGGTCVSATYKDNTGGVIGVTNEQRSFFGSKMSSLTGTATPVDASTTDAKYTVAFPSVPFSSLFPNSDGNYWVLDTDYTNYAIVWTCRDKLPLWNMQYLWILTRSRTPTDAVITAAKAKLVTFGLSQTNLLTTIQTGC